MAKILPTAEFEIKASRRLGLDKSEFDVLLHSGQIGAHEVFQITERGTMWEWVVLEVKEMPDFLTLLCFNWLPTDGDFIGEVTSSRPMKAVERKRYEKYLG